MQHAKNVTTLRTVAEHTEVCPEKDRVRRDLIEEVQRDRRRPQGVASISDGLLPMMSNLRHGAFFQGLDLEKAMVDVINNHRPRWNKRQGNFPDVEIREALHMDVRMAFRLFCDRGEINKYGLWDIDLTATIRSLFSEIMPSILQDATRFRYRGRLVVTAAVRSDGFHSFEERASYIRGFLPEGIEYVKHVPFHSNYYCRHRTYNRRAPMSQFILQGRR